jgi:hypothetical protein
MEFTNRRHSNGCSAAAKLGATDASVVIANAVLPAAGVRVLGPVDH